MAPNKEKALPSLPFFNKPSNESNSNSNSKFMTRILILFFIIILVIIIVAAVGGFNSQDTGKPGINMSGKGDGTFYNPSVGIGSCGWQNDDSEFVAALNAPQYGEFSDPADSPICGKCIKITGPNGSVKVKLVDKCPKCKRGDIDMSPAAFKKIAKLDDATSKSLINLSNLLLCNKKIFIEGAIPKSEKALFESDDEG
ncbi:riboflavin aldehydeforming enzyme, putative [Rhizophagus clarus]|uniref:Riboflavin aldehydeforming enzyme, putative n=1 Tax=Rhizophagus clarus TaxID=94130 RepID=A0A8H3MJ67_9GLOM|nr:riboflavin aldehydeforming enzyme, putative [Rhizophagus clarus]